MVYNSFLRKLSFRRCVLCRTTTSLDSPTCPKCLEDLPWLPAACPRCAQPTAGGVICPGCQDGANPLTACHGTFSYAFPVDRLINHYKHRQDLTIGRDLAELMARSLPKLHPLTVLVPIPLHRSRLNERGFNQALELCRHLSRLSNIPTESSLLMRTRTTTSQQSLDAEARQANIKGSLTVNFQRTIPRYITLVDDVMTTGSTLREAANVLRQAGAIRVDAWCLARAL